MPIAGKLEIAVVMKLRMTLIQTKQNALYDFAHQQKPMSAETSRALRASMAEETLDLMQAAPETDLMVTSEAVNFPGLAKQLEAPYAAHVESQMLEERFAAPISALSSLLETSSPHRWAAAAAAMSALARHLSASARAAL